MSVTRTHTVKHTRAHTSGTFPSFYSSSATRKLPLRTSVVNSGFLLSITFREETFPEDDIAVCPTIPMAVALPAGTDEATIVSHPLFGISNYYSNENCNLTIPVEDNHVGVLLVTVS